MGHRLRWALAALLITSTVAVADDRFAVLEFFGRPDGAYCSAAGPTMIALQGEMQGRAVLLEYDFDGFPSGRQDRFWATGASAMFLPLVMVGSGYRTSSGSVNYEPVYRAMIDDELARPARAAASAFWQRNGSAMRAYVEVLNLGDTDLEIDHEAAIWLIAYEKAAIGVSMTWVRSTRQRYLPFDLAPGESATTIIDSPPMAGVNWNNMAGLVVIEDRPAGGGGAYDMLQAAEALTAGLTASPDVLELSGPGSTAEVVLSGPHVLSWTATAESPWIEVTPSSGGLPAVVTVAIRSRLRPPVETEGRVRFSASGDGMAFEALADVTVRGPRHRRAVRR